MSNAIKLYGGHDSTGAQREVAVAADGRAFGRIWRFNGRGYAWTKWTPAEVTYVHTFVDKMGETHAYAEPKIACGFVNLPMINANARVRLPR